VIVAKQDCGAIDGDKRAFLHRRSNLTDFEIVD
jgi:hypothetical protein